MKNAQYDHEINKENDLKRGKFLCTVGKMYLNNKGVEMYATNNKDYILLVPKNMRTGRPARGFTSQFVKKDFYEKNIEHNISSIELERALNFCEIDTYIPFNN